MHIKVENNIIGMCATNTYYVYDDDSSEGILVDPAADAARIRARIEKIGFAPKAILLTHGHFDHILAVEELREFYKIPVYAAAAEKELLADPVQNLSGAWAGMPVKLTVDTELTDGEEFTAAGMKIRAILTPGHTPGGMCFYLPEGGILLSGDTLFCESVGRTDFPGGSHSALIRNIREKLFVLPGETVVYPGHGDDTTIDSEKRYNPFCL